MVYCKLSQCSAGKSHSRQAILAHLEPWKGIGGRDLDFSCYLIFHPKFAFLSSAIPKRGPGVPLPVAGCALNPPVTESVPSEQPSIHVNSVCDTNHLFAQLLWIIM